MKKGLLFVATAALALSACSNDEVIDVVKEGGISFRVLLDRSTKASNDAGNVTTTANIAPFKVLAFRDGTKESVIPLADVNKDGASGLYKTATPYYWPTPSTAKVQFYAYAPNNLGDVTLSDAAQKIEAEPAEALADQKDVVVAHKVASQSTKSGSVALHFKHIFSQIEVRAKNSKAEQMKVEILGVRLVNVKTKGTFTWPTDELDGTSNLSAAWAPADDEGAYFSKGTSAITLESSSARIMFNANNFMLVPQQLTAWAGDASTTGAYLSVLCRISSKNADGSYTLLYPQPSASDNRDGDYAFSATPINTNWEPGKRYIYTLNFFGENGGGGKVDPNPTPNGGGEGIVNPGGNGGDPVVGAPITFEVTVDEWTEAPAVNIDL